MHTNGKFGAPGGKLGKYVGVFQLRAKRAAARNAAESDQSEKAAYKPNNSQRTSLPDGFPATIPFV